MVQSDCLSVPSNIQPHKQLLNLALDFIAVTANHHHDKSQLSRYHGSLDLAWWQTHRQRSLSIRVTFSTKIKFCVEIIHSPRRIQTTSKSYRQRRVTKLAYWYSSCKTWKRNSFSGTENISGPSVRQTVLASFQPDHVTFRSLKN